VLPEIVGGELSAGTPGGCGGGGGGGGGGAAAGTVIVISAFTAGVPATPSAVSVTVYTALVVVLVFTGTVIVPVPLQLATDGSDSAAALAGSETALMLQLSAPVVANVMPTGPPLLEASVVDCGVNDVIVAVGPA
jgi:hypothetical protein